MYLFVPISSPEEVLVTDSDGRKRYVVCINNLDVDGLRVAVEEDESCCHKPDENCKRRQHDGGPHNPANRCHRGEQMSTSALTSDGTAKRCLLAFS